MYSTAEGIERPGKTVAVLPKPAMILRRIVSYVRNSTPVLNHPTLHHYSPMRRPEPMGCAKCQTIWVISYTSVHTRYSRDRQLTRLQPLPIKVCVFPEPVWPYARTQALNPLMTVSSAGTRPRNTSSWADSGPKIRSKEHLIDLLGLSASRTHMLVSLSLISTTWLAVNIHRVEASRQG